MMADAKLRFPGESFLSMAEFDAYCLENKDLLDARYAYEQRIGGEAAVMRAGTCAACLCPSHFTTPAEQDPSGPPLDWRERQDCDCADRLGNRARAVLHFLDSTAGLAASSRVALFGPPSVLDRRLAEGRGDGFVRLPRLVRAGASESNSGGWRLDHRTGRFHVVVCWDHLQHVPPLDAALAEIHRLLAEGGQFIFTIPFRYRAPQTISRLVHLPRRAGLLPAEFRGEVHEIGWDILTRLREAGFNRAFAHHYWSDELGYLGAFNILFSASR